LKNAQYLRFNSYYLRCLSVMGICPKLFKLYPMRIHETNTGIEDFKC